MHAASVQYFARYSERAFRTRCSYIFPGTSFLLWVMQIFFRVKKPSSCWATLPPLRECWPCSALHWAGLGSWALPGGQGACQADQVGFVKEATHERRNYKAAGQLQEGNNLIFLSGEEYGNLLSPCNFLVPSRQSETFLYTSKHRVPFPLLSSAVSAAMQSWMSSLWQDGYQSKGGVDCPVVILVFSTAWSDFR